MRNNVSALALVTTLVLPALAGAMVIDSVAVDADCNSWTTDVAVSVRPGATSAYLEYVVVLTDDAGVEMDRFEYGDFVDIPAGDTGVLSFGGAWHVALEAPQDMSAQFQLFDIFPDGYNVSSDAVFAPVVCGADEPDPVVAEDPCRYDFAYWRDAADWPLDQVELGGVSYDADTLRDLMSGPPRGDATVLLARQLVAARLNEAGGAADVPSDLLMDADSYLADHPLLSDPSRRDRQPAMRLASRLSAWNGSGCPGSAVAAGAGPDLVFGADAAKSAAVEQVNFGALKSMFR